MHNIELKSDFGVIAHKDDQENTKYYKPNAGSASDLYDALQNLAQLSPSEVLPTLKSQAREVELDTGKDRSPEDQSGQDTSSDNPRAGTRPDLKRAISPPEKNPEPRPVPQRN